MPPADLARRGSNLCGRSGVSAVEEADVPPGFSAAPTIPQNDLKRADGMCDSQNPKKTVS